MGAGRRIIDGLRDAIEGKFASVTIDGETWVKRPWQPLWTAPRDRSYILLLLGETIPDVPHVMVGSFCDQAGCVELGYEEYGAAGGWLIWHADCDFYVIRADKPRGWCPLPTGSIK